MAKDKASIYVDAQKMFSLLYDAQFAMAKRDQNKLGARLQDHCEQIIAYYELAHDLDGEDKKDAIKRLCIEFAIMKVLIRIAQDKHIIKDISLLNQIRALIVSMDEGIGKWRNYVFFGKGTH